MQWADQLSLHLLWLLVPLGLLLVFLVRRRERLLARLFDASVQDVLMPRRWRSRVGTRLTLWLLALALCVVALARPQWGYTLEEITRQSMDILVALDTSNSMLAPDLKPNRLQQAKWGIKDLVARLRSDRIGLIAFAGGSFLQCPLTIDYAAFMMTLDDVYAGIIPRGGTSISQALETAVEAFEDKSGADRAIILITDGEDHEGSPLELADKLKRKNIRVFAIGVGTREGELIPNPEEGETGFLKGKGGEVVKSALREDTLEQLALATGGIYVRSGAGDFGLDKIVDEGLSHLKRDETESKTIRTYEDRFLWALIPAFILLAIEAVLSEQRRRPAGG